MQDQLKKAHLPRGKKIRQGISFSLSDTGERRLLVQTDRFCNDVSQEGDSATDERLQQFGALQLPASLHQLLCPGLPLTLSTGDTLSH